MPAIDETRKPSLIVRLAFYLGVLLAALFLVVSIVTWNLPLGLCALLLALLLTYNLNAVLGISEERRP